LYRIDTQTAATAPDAIPAAGTEGYWTAGDPATGKVPTQFTPAWYNMMQEELRNVVVAAGLTPSKTDWTQVAKAVQSTRADLTGLWSDESSAPAGATFTHSGKSFKMAQDGSATGATINLKRGLPVRSLPTELRVLVNAQLTGTSAGSFYVQVYDASGTAAGIATATVVDTGGSWTTITGTYSGTWPTNGRARLTVSLSLDASSSDYVEVHSCEVL